MTLRKAHLGLAIILAFLSLVAVVLGNQREVYADTLAEDIICETYATLQAAGQPIPAELESACGGGSDGGGGTDVPDVPVDPCDIFDELGNLPPNCDGGGDNGGGEEPTDVCPNLEGVQAEVPEGKEIIDGQCVDQSTGGGGGGGNSGENTGTGSGGSSSGGGGGGGGGSVLGTSTPTYLEGVTSCDMYLTDFLKKGGVNAVEQVQRLQDVLQKDGFEVEVNGVFDENTHTAVLAFQTKYADSILTPWGLSTPTGFVYLTTRKQVNELYCAGKEFPLSAEEESIVKGAQPRSTGAVAGATNVRPAPKPVAPATPTIADTNPVEKQEEPAVSLPSNRISDFFRRLFDRFW